MIVAGGRQLMTEPVQDIIYTYYSDSWHTTVVGRLYDMCTGRWSTGTTSAYVDIEVGYPCSGGQCSTCIEPENAQYDPYVCWDGSDNDGDGLSDSYDPGCYCEYHDC